MAYCDIRREDETRNEKGSGWLADMTLSSFRLKY